MDSPTEGPMAANHTAIVGLMAATCVSTAFIIVSAPNSGIGSLVRYAWLAIVFAAGQQLFQAMEGLCTSIVINSMVMGTSGLVLMQCCNFLAIKRLDAGDLIKGGVFASSDSSFFKVLKTTCTLFNLRGIGTAWQISRVNAFPHFYERHSSNGKPGRASFIFRQLLILSWQYIFLDFVQISTDNTPPEETERLFGVGKEFVYTNATGEEWAGRVIVGVIAWIAPSRVTMDIGHRVSSVIFVLLGLSNPEDWPPLFSSCFEAYTLRGFWSTFWHQFCRLGLTSISNFICRDLLRLPRPSLIERYMNIAIVFLASGIFHVMVDMYSWKPPSIIPTMAFFGLFVVGIMIEDGVQALCRRITGVDTRKNDQRVPLWHKIVGYLWVSFWLSMTTPWYLYHNARVPAEQKWVLPVSVVKLTGEAAGQVLLLAGGLGLKFAISGEI